MSPSLPFRWVNPFQTTSSDINTNTIYTQSATLPVDPRIDPRAIAQASVYDHVSHRPDLDSEQESTGDEEPVAEYHNIRHIPTEYGTAVDCGQWTRQDQGQFHEGIQEAQEQSQRPIIRRGSAYASVQAMLRRFSWGSSSHSSSSQYLAPPLEISTSFLSLGYDVTPDEAPEEDPLAFAKEGVVEVRQGETEQISPAVWDVRLKRRGLRESVGDWLAGLRKSGAEREW